MNWEEIKAEYETTTITLKALAEKHGAKLGTLKSRKSREGWERDATSKKDATNRIRDATPDNKAKDKRHKGKRSGNPNPKNQFGERNTASLKHGIFSKYLPQETLDIINEMQDKTPADLLYDQIQIQYATIIRSQQIMYVQDKDDMAKERSQHGWGDSGADKYDIQFAWDRHATFVASMSRAMGTLGNLIKQFNNIAHEDDERRLKLEQMQLNVDKTKVETEFLQARADLIKGTKKDTTLLEALIAAKGGGGE
ncbi:phage terminase small subunit [Bacillus sp. JCM 19041]|uniref:phage terminase small subunit n=1 Tax=Bacillus sp. JCM 19041 TaxID=1460637 RepID=UPI0006D02985